MKIKLKYHSTEPRFCQVLYKSPKGGVYCIMENRAWGRVTYDLYICSKDGEPSHIVDMNNFCIPDSKGDNGIDVRVNEFLEQMKEAFRQMREASCVIEVVR